jgi:hypothetical protein
LVNELVEARTTVLSAELSAVLLLLLLRDVWSRADLSEEPGDFDALSAGHRAMPQRGTR